MNITLCTNPDCRHVLNLKRVTFEERPVAHLPGIYEVGFCCPFCKLWRSSYFINSKLKEMEPNRDKWTRQERRYYFRELKKLQYWAKRKRERVAA